MIWFEHIFWTYVQVCGTEISDRKCFFRRERTCDMNCPHAKVEWIDDGKDASMFIYCNKFKPPIRMREVYMILKELEKMKK